jgi:bifunctional oligoribonuclease and PAP phosphatase NrnA
MAKTADLERASAIVKGHDEALVIGHQFPDGDAIGSVLGLGLMLKAAGYEVQASWPEPFEIPEKYSFLPGAELLVKPELVGLADPVAFALDCANAGRLEELREKVLTAPVVNMDHHPDNSLFGNANLVDPASSATAEIVYGAAASFGLTIDKDVAICLYTGIVTDTGRFQFSNTTGTTLRIAAELVEAGVEPHRVYENVYQSDSLPYLRLSGEVLSSAVYDCELGLIYGTLMQADLERFGVKMNETEDLIDNLRALRGHKVAALLKELTDGSIRVSLRSRVDVDIGSIARKLGGGGHRVAAGYTSSRKNVDEALSELKGEIIASGWGSDTE